MIFSSFVMTSKPNRRIREYLFKDSIDLRTSYTLRPRQAYVGCSEVSIRTTLSLVKIFETSAILDYVADFTPKWIMATFAACPASYFFVKTSILLFYLRVFQLQAKLRYIIYGRMDLVADLLVLAFPVPIVLKLQISRSQKVYLLFVFLAGIR